MRSCAQKVAVPPESVFAVLLNDALVGSGSSLALLTALARAFLAEAPVDDLVAWLRRGRVEDRMARADPAASLRRTAARRLCIAPHRPEPRVCALYVRSWSSCRSRSARTRRWWRTWRARRGASR